jgi:hypothetical protein
VTYLRRKVALTLGLAGVAGIVVGAMAACASAREGGDAVDEEARAVAGCYQFRWDEGARALGLPWGFELRTGPLEGWPNLEGARTAVTRPTSTSAADHPFGFWRPAQGDSIMLGHPGGGGFALTLAPAGDDLVGWGRATGDAVAPGETTPGADLHAVKALRVVCPDLES